MLTLEDDGTPAQPQSVTLFHWGAARSSGRSHPELDYMVSLSPESKSLNVRVAEKNGTLS